VTQLRHTKITIIAYINNIKAKMNDPTFHSVSVNLKQKRSRAICTFDLFLFIYRDSAEVAKTLTPSPSPFGRGEQEFFWVLLPLSYQEEGAGGVRAIFALRNMSYLRLHF
jgi:hypothetical protein